MRNNNKKNNYLLYIVVGILLAAVVWVISREIPLKQELVEQTIENTFAK